MRVSIHYGGTLPGASSYSAPGSSRSQPCVGQLGGYRRNRRRSFVGATDVRGLASRVTSGVRRHGDNC